MMHTRAVVVLAVLGFGSGLAPSSIRLPAVTSSMPPGSALPPWTHSIAADGAPLHYMDFYQHQEDVLGRLGATPLPLDASLALAVNHGKEARIASACYSTDMFRKVRMTYFDAGHKVQVFNSLWYPQLEYDAPVLGVDLLCFGKQKILAVIDCQPLVGRGGDGEEAESSQLFVDIKEKYPSLCGKMSNRYYDENQFFSSGMLFGRFEEPSPIASDVLPAFQEYLQAYLDLVGSIPTDTSPEAKARVHAQQAAYDQYSAERDPAHSLFVSYFGKEWADEYMSNFLFEMSDGATQGH